MSRVAVITGTTSGIGEQLARTLAAADWSLVLVNRDPERARPLAVALGDSVAGSIAADLADHRSLREGTAEILRRFPAIDLLVNNAGVQLGARRNSPQGIEMHFEVNTLAPYQLARLLAEPLAAARGMVLTVVSRAMFHTRTLDVERLTDPSDARPLFGPYTQSKFAVAVVMHSLASEYARRDIVLRMCCPGPTKTAATRGEGMPKFLRPVRALAFQSPVDAAGKLVHALDGSFGRETDLYIQGTRGRQLPAQAADSSLQQRLLALCRELTGV